MLSLPSATIQCKLHGAGWRLTVVVELIALHCMSVSACLPFVVLGSLLMLPGPSWKFQTVGGRSSPLEALMIPYGDHATG